MLCRFLSSHRNRVDLEGFEPSTSRVSDGRSTAELQVYSRATALLPAGSVQARRRRAMRSGSRVDPSASHTAGRLDCRRAGIVVKQLGKTPSENAPPAVCAGGASGNFPSESMLSAWVHPILRVLYQLPTEFPAGRCCHSVLHVSSTSSARIDSTLSRARPRFRVNAL